MGIMINMGLPYKERRARGELTSIEVSKSLKEYIRKRGEKGESYESIIRRLVGMR